MFSVMFPEQVRKMPEDVNPGHNRPLNSCLNDDFYWNALDSGAYWKRNYATPHEIDCQFVAKVRDFFSGQLGGRSGLSGVDVGTGPNLYPPLAMLPFCDEVTLIDRSESNIKWLDGQLGGYSEAWDPFWKILAEKPAYARIKAPREAMSRRAKTMMGSIFDLPTSRWDVGTMFFVAESISREKEEFRAAVIRFVEALRPDSPYAIAFMENSEGWEVGEEMFPAVPIGVTDVRECLDGRTTIHEIHRIDAGENRFREGYTGMILACGRTRELIT